MSFHFVMVKYVRIDGFSSGKFVLNFKFSSWYLFWILKHLPQPLRGVLASDVPICENKNYHVKQNIYTIKNIEMVNRNHEKRADFVRNRVLSMIFRPKLCFVNVSNELVQRIVSHVLNICLIILKFNTVINDNPMSRFRCVLLYFVITLDFAFNSQIL